VDSEYRYCISSIVLIHVGVHFYFVGSGVWGLTW